MRKLGKSFIDNMPCNVFLRIESHIYNGYLKILESVFFCQFYRFLPKMIPTFQVSILYYDIDSITSWLSI